MRTLTCVMALALLAAPALADWDPIDGTKMHYPQFPDPEGWDVRATYYTALADDFMCMETGPITDFHIWTSYKGDQIVDMADIEFIHTAIYTDVPATTETWSMPGELRWHHDWMLDPPIGPLPTMRPAGTGTQGWYDPLAGLVLQEDHHEFQQWNFFIDDPADAFEQQEGEIYWLEMSFKLTAAAIEDGKRIGWKTSGSQQWNDDAVYREVVEGQEPEWLELTDPIYPQESLDLAFVITPEPASLMLLATGAGALLMRRRRRR